MNMEEIEKIFVEKLNMFKAEILTQLEQLYDAQEKLS